MFFFGNGVENEILSLKGLKILVSNPCFQKLFS